MGKDILIVFFVVLAVIMIIVVVVIGFSLIKQARSLLEKGQSALEEALQQHEVTLDEKITEEQVVQEQVIQQSKETKIKESNLLLQESIVDSDTVLQMFSGGRDSLLAACRLLDAGHSVLLVTYDNGCTLYSDHAKTTANCLIEKYGKIK